MRHYETVMIARQDISTSQVEALTDQFVAHLQLEENGMSRREYWGLRNLAYRIKKNRKGHYVLLNYTAASDNVAEMERNMRLSEDVLRYMTVRTDDAPEGASVVLQRKDERSTGRGREGRDGGRGEGRGGRGRPSFDAAPETEEAEA